MNDAEACGNTATLPPRNATAAWRHKRRHRSFAAARRLIIGGVLLVVGLVLSWAVRRILKPALRRGGRIQAATPMKGGFDIGEVEDISLGVTIIVTDDNRRVIVANGTMTQRTVVKLPPA